MFFDFDLALATRLLHVFPGDDLTRFSCSFGIVSMGADTMASEAEVEVESSRVLLERHGRVEIAALQGPGRCPSWATGQKCAQHLLVL